MDQTRGWFYSLLAIATGVFDRTPYQHVIVNEMILDAAGQKMSKSRGNIVDPVRAVADHGADAVRLYLLLSSQVWLPKRFDESQIFDVAGNMLDKLRHSYSFFQQYAEDWTPGDPAPAVPQRPLEDRWILSRLDATVRAVRAAWDGYDVTAGARAIVEFVVDDLSNWWVRRTRPRFWQPGEKADPAALATLHEVMSVTMRLLAPAAPFLPDLLHRALTGTSVHLASFPEPDDSRRDPALERAMDVVRRLASLARSARERLKVRVRQPLARMLAAVPNDVSGKTFEALLPLLADEVNVKRLELVSAGTDLVSLEAKPSFRALGKRFGSATKAAADAVSRLSSDDVARYELGEPVEIVVEGAAHRLEPGDVQIIRHAKGDLLIESDGELVAALDPAVSSELKEEGLARELVSRVQRMRKDAGYNIADRIVLWVGGDEAVRAAATRHAGYIKGETLATRFDVAGAEPAADLAQDLDLDGVNARIAVKRAALANG